MCCHFETIYVGGPELLKEVGHTPYKYLYKIWFDMAWSFPKYLILIEKNKMVDIQEPKHLKAYVYWKFFLCLPKEL